MNFMLDGKPLTYGRARVLLGCIRDMAFDDLPKEYRCRFLYGQEGTNEVDCDINAGNVRLDLKAEYGEIKDVAVVLPDEYRLPEYANKPVDCDEFVEILVAIMHERRHVVQHMEAQNGGSAYSDLMFVTHLSLAGNKDYYHENYFRTSTEIDAQYNALWTSYSVLSGLVGPEMASTYVCRYEKNLRDGADGRAKDLLDALHSNIIDQDKYDEKVWLTGKFVQNPTGGRFVSVWTMLDAYKVRLSESITEKRSFPEKFVKNWDGNAGKYFSEHMDVYDRFCATDYGYRQSCMLVNIQYECGNFESVLRLKDISSLKYDENQEAKRKRINMAFVRHGLKLSDETIMYQDWNAVKSRDEISEMRDAVGRTAQAKTVHDVLRIKDTMPYVKALYEKASKDEGLDGPW